ncbi:MAG: hypothetical protein FWH40_07305 [Coriobacteriia bacterium]|nr:hypothetical protein [Coriobacteriia bacterium]
MILSGRTSDPGSSDWILDFTFNNVTLVNSSYATTSANWPAGIYYFFARVHRSGLPGQDQESTAVSGDMLLNNWYASFADPTELTTRKFQPQVATNIVSH